MKRVDPSIAWVLLVLSMAFGRASAQNAAAIGGVVRDPHGVPQLGALVELLGPGSAVTAHTYTDEHGRFLLSTLEPGRYQLRTSAAFLLTSLRRNVQLISGGRTLADITMGALFEVGDWFPVQRRSSNEPGDDWRWTLRSSAERPLLRLAGSAKNSSAEDSPMDVASASTVPGSEPSASPKPYEISDRLEAVVESMVQFGFMAGSEGLMQDGPRQIASREQKVSQGGVLVTRASLGTAAEEPADGNFTSGNRSTGMQASFDLSAGYEQSSQATHAEWRSVAGFTSRPELSGAGSSGFQAVTLATGERILLGDLVTIDAGTLLSAERLVASRMNTSPFLRVVAHPSASTALMYRYAGSTAIQSLDDVDDAETDPLELTPLIDGQGVPLRNPAAHQEIALAYRAQQNVTTLAVYRDAFVAGMLEGSGALRAQELIGLPVVANAESGTFLMSVQGYTAHGVHASWTHTLSPSLKATLEADLGTTLALRPGESSSLAELQHGVYRCNQAAVSAELAGAIAPTATSFTVQYHWQPTKTLSLINAFDTPRDKAYTSLSVRQGIWRGRELKRISAVLEASNLLEEGYQPIVGPDGKTLFLAQVPRAVQAGLAFSF